VRNFQPPIDGDEIMTIFDIQPGRIIGDIKDQIKEAILDGQIKNDRQEAYALMLKIASEKGIHLKINTP
jgi:hypothetical protein